MAVNYLLDKSAMGMQLGEAGAELVESLATAGRIAVCEISRMEILYSARNWPSYVLLTRQMNLYRYVSITGAVWEQAISTQAALTRRGQHRLPLPDQLVAAAAAVHGLTVLHHDRQFETIGAVTGQPVQRITELLSR